ncbi:MAG TPA: TetR/AcrR family transcriptional regulator [Streptosporangiaceae bacterium]|jgi:AcrR family transcriptional regulator
MSAASPDDRRDHERQHEGRYHHGDLPAALVDAAIEVIAQRGVRGFSVAEASRRVGVSAAAPYRHFSDREDLLAAVAIRGLRAFAAMVAAEAGDAPVAEQRLCGMARAYVRFAGEQRALFDTIFSAGIDKSRYPELERAWEPIDAFLAVVRELCDGDGEAAGALAEAIEATAHGHAMLLIDGQYGGGPGALAIAADRAAAAVRAIIAGRGALLGPR